MAFRGFNKIGKAFADEGKFHYQYVYKTTTPNPGTAGYFVDMNQTIGIPKYNSFAGGNLKFNALTGAGNGGVYVGPTISGSTKHLLRWQGLNINAGANGAPDWVMLLDYLGFYRLINCDSTDAQDMVNTDSLTRYTDGEGVRIVLIVTEPMTVTASVTITYTNTADVSGRTATANLVPGLDIGVCATGTGSGGVTAPTPFFPLASGDSGVKSIQQVTLAAAAGGFVTAALVKPIANLQIYDPSVPSEKLFGAETHMLPEIKTGAYLNFIIQRSGSAAGALQSELLFVNS
jgi:hypothetical protein